MDKYIIVQLGKSKYAVARQRPGGWYGIVGTTDSETMAGLMLEALSKLPRTKGDRDASVDWRKFK